MGIPRVRPGGESSNPSQKKDEVLSIDGHTREWMLENFDQLELFDEDANQETNNNVLSNSIQNHKEIDYELSDEDDLGDLSMFVNDVQPISVPQEYMEEPLSSQNDFEELIEEIPHEGIEDSEHTSLPSQNILTDEEIQTTDEDDLDMLLGLDEIEEEFSKIQTPERRKDEVVDEPATSIVEDDFFSAFDNLSFDEPAEEEFSFDDFDPFSPDTNDLGSSAPLAEEISFEDFATPENPLESEFFNGFEDFATPDFNNVESNNEFTENNSVNDFEDFSFFDEEENTDISSTSDLSDSNDFSFDDNDFSFDNQIQEENQIEDFASEFDDDFNEEDENEEFGDFSFDDNFDPDDNEENDDAFSSNDVDFDEIFNNVSEDEDEIEENSYFGESFEEPNNDEFESFEEPVEENSFEEEPQDEPEKKNAAKEKKSTGGIFRKLKDKAQAIKNEVAAEMRGEEYNPEELSIDEKNKKQQLRAEREAEDEQDDFDEDKSQKSPGKKSGGSGKGGGNPFSFIGKMYKTLAGFLFGIINSALKILASLPIVGRIFRPILSMTRLLEKLALFMPALLLVIIFVIVQLVVVPISSNSDLPDSGAISISKFEYDKDSGSVSALAENKGDTIADVTVDFKIYALKPELNPITWFVPKEIAACSSEPVSVDIDGELTVDASCDAVSGILVRATGKAIG